MVGLLCPANPSFLLEPWARSRIARWLNHSCTPNCEAIEDERGRVFIDTIRPLMPGEELYIAYGLIIDEAVTAKLAAAYACRCGTTKCAGSMLAVTRG